MATILPYLLSTFRGFWNRLDDMVIQPIQEPKPYKSSASANMERLAAPSQLAKLPKIEYLYDPLPALPIQSNHHLSKLPSQATSYNGHFSSNSIPLNPLSAGLPYRSSLDHVRASKFWDSNLSETVRLLQMLAVDDSASDIEVDHGITVAKLAKKALRPGLEHQMVLATHYMFPGADQQRIKQISALMIIYFVFDGSSTLLRVLHR